MLVGAPLSGKTTVYRVLADAMNLVAYREGESNSEVEPIHIQVPGDDAGEKDGGSKTAKEKEGVWQGVDIKVVHPKSLTLGQLFGNVVNAEWQEGLLSSMIREMSSDTSGTLPLFLSSHVSQVLENQHRQDLAYILARKKKKHRSIGT
jgi:hypothetical protein